MEPRTERTPDLSGTDRTELRAITPRAAAALFDGAAGGFVWAPGGPYQGTMDACAMLVRADQLGVYQPEWGVYAIVRTEDGTAVGGIGFHGPPSEGLVEIGYDLAESARGLGYATEAVRSVVAYALGRPGVLGVVAHTEPTNTASQAVLLRVGFEPDGTVQDETEGPLFRFVRRTADKPPADGGRAAHAGPADGGRAAADQPGPVLEVPQQHRG